MRLPGPPPVRQPSGRRQARASGLRVWLRLALALRAVAPPEQAPLACRWPVVS